LCIEAAGQTPACAEVPRSAVLDLWVGKGCVVDDKGAALGSNRIEKVLKGCVLLEQWRDADDSEDRSLLYANANTQLWRQVWVADDTRYVNGINEKTLVSAPGDPAVRFQGMIVTQTQGVILDRAMLIAPPDCRVRQTIEISPDAGTTRTVGFNALHEPAH
jgi:hypothetical protein